MQQSRSEDFKKQKTIRGAQHPNQGVLHPDSGGAAPKVGARALMGQWALRVPMALWALMGPYGPILRRSYGGLAPLG